MEKLIFGDKLAVTNTNPQVIATQISKIVPSLQYFEAISNKTFSAKTFSISINNLKISANYVSPFRVSASSSNEYTLMIPINGKCTTTVENKNFVWDNRSFAYCKPRCEAKSVSLSPRNFVLIDLDIQRFHNTTKTMLGVQSNEVLHNFENPTLIPLQYKNISFSTILQQLFKVLDDNLDDINTLKKAKFDEIIYRTLVFMFMPEKFYKNDIYEQKVSKVSTSMLSLVDELKNEDFFAFMTLSDLERFFDQGTRNLQIIFNKYYHCTPTQFLREQKLRYANRVIVQSEGDINVSNLALETGFYDQSLFAKYYKERFGISPSQSIKTYRGGELNSGNKRVFI